MADDPDFFERQTQSRVRLPRLLRALLAILVLLGAMGFFGVALLTLAILDRPGLPSASGAILLALFMAALGVGSGYIGIKLLLIKQHTDHLFTALGSRIASYCVAVVGVLMIVGSIFISTFEYVPGGLFALLMAHWLYVSSKSFGPRTHR